MDDMVTVVREDNGHLNVTFRLSSRWEAWRMAVIMTAAADWQSATRKEGSRWRRAGSEIKKYLQDTEPVYPRKNKQGISAYLRPARPPSAYSSDSDMSHVLYGRAPFPLLSVRDMRTVYPLLEARKMSARHIAERLYVHHRTVVRWRGETRQREARQRESQETLG